MIIFLCCFDQQQKTKKASQKKAASRNEESFQPAFLSKTAFEACSCHFLTCPPEQQTTIATKQDKQNKTIMTKAYLVLTTTVFCMV
jgi:hypothetical protein